MKRILLVVSLIAALSSLSFAQGLGYNGVAGHVGLLLPQEDGLETGFGFGVKVDMGQLSDGLTLLPKLMYQMPGVEDVPGVEIDVSAIVIGADVQYGINENVYAGGGLALYAKSGETTVEFFGQKRTSDTSESDIGISLLGGYKLMLGNMKAAIEASYNIVADYNHIEIGLDVFFGN